MASIRSGPALGSSASWKTTNAEPLALARPRDWMNEVTVDVSLYRTTVSQL
jgi:hypothetical protein